MKHYFISILAIIFQLSHEENISHSRPESQVDPFAFKDKSILGGVIISNQIHHHTHPHPQSKNIDWEAISVARQRNSHILRSNIPFPVDEWPAIYTGPCPNRYQAHNERGLMYAHYQIIFDFIHFDREILVKSHEYPNESFKSTNWFKDSGKYLYEYKDGKYYREGVVQTDDDILVVFEDDAILTKRNTSQLLYKELSNMNSDLVRLGWCGEPTDPMCTVSYAITRRGAKKLVENYDPCGAAIDWYELVK